MVEPAHTLTAIIPCNDLDTAEAFWNRLGFFQDAASKNEHGDYRMLSDGKGADVHLTDAVEGWVVPGRNPFGVYLYTREVDEAAAAMQDAVIEKSKRAEHKPWAMYEISLNGPDDLLVRIGYPSRLM